MDNQPPTDLTEGRQDHEDQSAPAPVALDASAAAAAAAPVTVFQPVVSIADENIVGYEALSRWPSLTNTSTGQVFARATATGTVGELDQRCIRTAARSAVGAPFPDNTLLLINTEPSTAPVSRDEPSLAGACDRFQVVFELTERGLWDHPKSLLAKVATLRDNGIGVALDDVGSHPDVLAWLDVIDPDVVKLDLSLIQRHPAAEQARVLNAVYGHHERTGAVIVAEGIETESHLEQAHAVGATLGQGYRFGRPAPADRVAPIRSVPPAMPRRARQRRDIGTPFDLVSQHRAARTAPKHLLAAFSRDIEHQAEHAVDRPLVLAAVQHANRMPDSARARYQRLTQSCSLVAVFGQELFADPAAGMIQISLDADDPLCLEWTVVILGSHTVCALIAREQDGPAADADDRRFTFVITNDRAVVTAAASNLLSRIA